MKLRYKKTGAIKDFGNLQVYAEAEGTDDSQLLGNFDSFKQILEYYEDYIPSEPLIKDEKIRKAVRAWAEANNVTKVWHEGSSVAFRDGAVSIIFHGLCWEEIPKGEYTITELCGEEEEMSIEITDELSTLVEEHKHYGTEATARHLAAYICEEMEKEEKE